MWRPLRFGTIQVDPQDLSFLLRLLFQDGMPELRNDPRFARLCARLGLVEFWMATDKWPDCVDEVSYDFKAEGAKVQDLPKEDFWFSAL
ncbi:MAG: hypothetical protein AB7G75_10415 [Candidatus Binatia bacterium]